MINGIIRLTVTKCSMYGREYWIVVIMGGRNDLHSAIFLVLCAKPGTEKKIFLVCNRQKVRMTMSRKVNII